MGRRPRYNKRTVLQAIEGSGGIVSAVAKRLGCDWNTAQYYIQRWPETKAAFEAERERILDLAETTLYRAIQEGDAQAAKWLLSRLARHRGYGDHVVWVRLEREVEALLDFLQKNLDTPTYERILDLLRSGGTPLETATEGAPRR